MFLYLLRKLTNMHLCYCFIFIQAISIRLVSFIMITYENIYNMFSFCVERYGYFICKFVEKQILMMLCVMENVYKGGVQRIFYDPVEYIDVFIYHIGIRIAYYNTSIIIHNIQLSSYISLFILCWRIRKAIVFSTQRTSLHRTFEWKVPSDVYLMLLSCLE